MIPKHLIGGLQRYVNHGVPPGSLLSACIDNNFVEACVNADHISAGHLQLIAFWLYNDAPTACWGSKKKRLDWIARGGLQGPLPPRCSACAGRGTIVNAESESQCPECDGEGVRRAGP